LPLSFVKSERDRHEDSGLPYDKLRRCLNREEQKGRHAKCYALAIGITVIEVASLVWKYIEVVGESPESFADAVRDAIAQAGKTVRGMEWFEVTSFRGTIAQDKVKRFQAVVKIGFRVER